jgi:D-threo-aldose 1-dehydrogenase
MRARRRRLFRYRAALRQWASEIRIGKALGGITRDEYPLIEGRDSSLRPRRTTRAERLCRCAAVPATLTIPVGTLRSIDESLQRLGVSRLDIVYIHDIDRDTHGAAYAQRSTRC